MHDLNVKDRVETYNRNIGGAISRTCLEQNLELKNKVTLEGENEIKMLLDSGFIIKSDENFMLNVYGRINKEIRNSYKGIFKNGNYAEVRGASFRQMTIYGRNLTVKNIIMSREKLTEINSRNNLNDYRVNYEINDGYRLAELTLKNYFSLKKKNMGVDTKNTIPGKITVIDNGSAKKIEYSNKEMPSFFKFELDDRKSILDRKPEIGVLKNYRGTIDGFKNSKVTINGKKILEMESMHNWQKIKDYIRQRDFSHISGNNGLLNKVEIHHIKQLQDGGKENINNFVALSENTHKLADSYRLLIDKNISFYREMDRSKIEEKNINSITAKNINTGNLIKEIGRLNLADKIFFNSLKLEIESNSSLRINMLLDKTDSIKMHFIDSKTGEEFRLVASKLNNETDKIIVKTAVHNFISDFPTSK